MKAMGLTHVPKSRNRKASGTGGVNEDRLGGELGIGRARSCLALELGKGS